VHARPDEPDRAKRVMEETPMLTDLRRLDDVLEVGPLARR
jgi:hypothetical protein